MQRRTMRMKPCILPVCTISNCAAFHSSSCVFPSSSSCLFVSQPAHNSVSCPWAQATNERLGPLPLPPLRIAPCFTGAPACSAGLQQFL